jgi:hypothetical protein
MALAPHPRLGLLLRCTLGDQRRVKRRDVVEEPLGCRHHEPDYYTSPMPCLHQGESRGRSSRSNHGQAFSRPPRLNRIAPVNAVEHVGQLRQADRDGARGP